VYRYENTIAMTGSTDNNRLAQQLLHCNVADKWLKTEVSITVSAFVETVTQNKMNRNVID